MTSEGIKSTDLAKELGIKSTEIVTAVGKIRSAEFKKGTTTVKLTTEEADKVRAMFKPAEPVRVKEKPAERAPAAAAPAPESVPHATKKAEAPTPPPAPPVEQKSAPEPSREQRPAQPPYQQRQQQQGQRPQQGQQGQRQHYQQGQRPPYQQRQQQQVPTAKVPQPPSAPPKVFIPTQVPSVPEVPKTVIVAEDVEVLDRFKKDVEADKVEKIKVKPQMQRAFQAIRKIEPKKWADAKGGQKKHFRGDQRFRRGEQSQQQLLTTAPRKKSIKIEEGTSIKEFAELIGAKIPDVIKQFMGLGIMPTINTPVDMDAALMVAEHFGVKIESVTAEHLDVVEEVQEDVSMMTPRAPVVTIMGHVDHGKTSLLDAIRSTKVTESEAGGITQHIGAYKVSLQGREITFLDTPGHEAFTALRARGAKVTDVVVLVVAADDGVMPQTIEAIDHAKAAGVPVVVAVNKIDKDNANPTKVKNELAEHGVVSEEWGGATIFVEVSAKKRIGIESLLEMILLQAEVMELKANPNKPARGYIIEAKLDKGRGPVATVLIQSGTLKSADAFVAGTASGKVRALISDTGKKMIEAGPSVPVEVLGFSEVPNAGDVFSVVEDEKKARQVAMARLAKMRAAEIVRRHKLTLDELYAKIKEGEIRDLNIVIKGDAQGSIEAMKKSFEEVTHPEVKVRVIHAAIGGINESDVMLASASNAIIIGFNVRPEPKAAQLAEKEGVDVRLYSIIYEAINDVKTALEGMLKPTLKEKVLGRAEIRQTYQVSRVGTIAGCYVIDGLISRNCDGVRIIRNNIVAYEGKLGSLKRFKDDVKEVAQGYECGITIENYNDLKVGDVIENFIIEKIAAKL
ncbi:MAG TPA: translation initiation factor IF-2 [Dissulfurispiraceae bacterium]|nr:translation initiation factor IF-2 [Dissulfurispiraceae bacterium]